MTNKSKITVKLLNIFLMFCMLLSLVPMSSLTAMAAETLPTFSGDSGTATDPYLIATADDLVALANVINSGDAAEYDTENAGVGNYYGYYFKQAKDIDLTGVAWEPIGYSGDEGKYFAGNYDGDGHSVVNAASTGKVDSYGYATAGIFGWVFSGSVSNLHVKNADFTATGQSAYSFAGGLIAVTYGATVTNCSVSDSKIESKRNPSNNNCAGGVSGYSTGGIFQKCASIGNTITGQAYSGGLIGEVDDSYGAGFSGFTSCYTAKCSVTVYSANVQDWNLVGGFLGTVTDDGGAEGVLITDCFVFDTDILLGENTKGRPQLQGVFANFLWPDYDSMITTNCYYGECGDIEANIGTAAEKTASEFADGTVFALLGDTFVQGEEYPIFKGPADYSKVDAAIKRAEALNKEEYKDFSAVEAAVDDVVRDKDNGEQAAVDAMAKAIEDAIAALEYKKADYSKVDEAISRANALNKDDYKDISAVKTAVEAVIRDKNITEQAEVDAMAKAIEDAIAALEKKPVTVPDTGDNSNILLSAALLLVSGAGILAAVLYGKKATTGLAE